MSPDPGTSAQESPSVVCPDCGTSYKWKPQFAGKELHCRCGCTFQPETPQTVEQPAAQPEQVYGHYAAAMGRPSSIKHALEDRSFDAKPSRLRNVYIPAILLPTMFVIEVGLLFRFVPEVLTGWWWPIVVAVGLVILQTVVLMPLMLVSLALTARWFDLELGPIGQVSFKAGALVLGTMGIADIFFMLTMVFFEFDHWALVAGVGYYLLTSAAPLAILFLTGVYETALVLALNFLPRVMIVYAMGLAWPHLFP